MKNVINFNFGKTLEEMENKKVKFCFTNKSLLLIDNNKKIYQLEFEKVGSYLDRLIKNGETVEFEHIEKTKHLKINDIWDIEKVKNFMSYI